MFSDPMLPSILLRNWWRKSVTSEQLPRINTTNIIFNAVSVQCVIDFSPTEGLSRHTRDTRTVFLLGHLGMKHFPDFSLHKKTLCRVMRVQSHVGQWMVLLLSGQEDKNRNRREADEYWDTTEEGVV